MKNVSSKILRYGAGKVSRASIFSLLAGVCLLDPGSALGVATRLPNQDPEGIARGNAEAATADNPSAIYYNPAGITQLEGLQTRVGIYLISADTHFSSATTGATAWTDKAFQAVPQVYATYSLKDAPLSFGLGVYAPYGLSLNWGDENPFRTAAQNAKLLYASVNPVVAWKVLPKLSIAIGPTINYSQAQLRRGIGLTPGDQFQFKGNALDYGFNAGLLWQVSQQWSVGVNYRYATTLDYHGHSETSPSSPFPPYYPATTTTASLHFPQFIVGGISYRPTTNWNFEFDLDWTDWDSVNQVVFKGTPLGDLPFILNYTSSFMYDFGVTRQLGKGYFLCAGYIYSENSSPDKYFNPIVPDADLHLFSLGIGHRGHRWDWALGYTLAYGPGRTVSGSIYPNVDGTYHTLNNAINIAATIKF